jgi:hypothetical protein
MQKLAALGYRFSLYVSEKVTPKDLVLALLLERRLAIYSLHEP